MDPKLGINSGALVAYLPRRHLKSNQSMIGVGATYSNTDSLVAVAFADLYWDGNKHKLTAGGIYGGFKNSCDNFLGTGMTTKTEDPRKAGAIRYRHFIVKNWYLGKQFIRPNYTS